MATLKELSSKEVLVSPGHRACAGCGFPVIIKQALLAADNPVVVGCATGCMEVCTTIYPYTAWKVPFIHNAFENSAATVSGVEAAYKSLRRQGKIDKKIENMEVRLSRYQETMIAKYAAMESMLNTLQSQQSWLSSQISSLTGNK